MSAAAGIESHQGRFNFVNRGDHGAAIGGRGFVQSRLHDRYIVPNPRALEYGTQQVRGEVPEPLIGVEPFARIGALQTDRALQRQPRQQVGAPSADGKPRRLYPLQCREHIGPLDHEIGRDAHGNGIE